jgi:hypothetical protein
MFGQTYYHGTLRKYVTLFGTLFNDIYVNRYSSSKDITQTIKVPLSYGPKAKTLARLEANPDLDKPVAIVLPRIGFEITTISYSPQRKLNTINRNAVIDSTDTNRLKYQYNPVPYDITFSLYIMCTFQEDGTQILEQILPYFTPEWTATISVIPEMDVNMDIPLVLLNVTPTDTYEGPFEERRIITWTLDFTMKGYFFGPVKKSKQIKLVDVNFFDASDFDDINSAVGQFTGNNDTSSSFSVSPGLTANGLPTSNSNASIDSSLIGANTNYGYIITKG